MFLYAETSFADGFENTIYIRLIFSGCKKALAGKSCKNCHNPELWRFDADSEVYGGLDQRLHLLEKQLSDWKSDEIEFDGVSIIGGEPLDQSADEAKKILDLVAKYYPQLPIFLYTGFEEEKFFRNPELCKHPFAQKASYIKFGPYVEELRTPEDSEERPALGSINQSIYKISRQNKSLLFTKIR